MTYTLKDLQSEDKEKSMIYYKIEDFVILNKKHYFIIGHLVFSAEKSEDNNLNLEIFNTETKEKLYLLNIFILILYKNIRFRYCRFAYNDRKKKMRNTNGLWIFF